ncbi:MAG TPA: DUF983 domain-containing protein [Acidimicrobiales bacterium]
MDPDRAPAPTPGRMLRRGLTKRCPVCGSGHLFHGWFRMKDRCPGCDFKFEREEGFFLGAYTINLAIAEGLVLLLGIVPLIWLLATRPDVSIWPLAGIGLVAALLAPLLFYPFSRTIWSAIDLILRPLHRPEPADRHHVRPRAAP